MKKLFWRDFKSIFLPWAIITGIYSLFALAAYAVKRAEVLGLKDFVGSDVIMELSEPIMFVLYGATVVYFVAVLILICCKFRKNLFSDEGYLVFTLPIKRKKVFLSKFLAGWLYCIITLAVIIGAFTAVAESNLSYTLNGMFEFRYIMELYRYDPKIITPYIIYYALYVFIAAFLSAGLLLILFTGIVILSKEKRRAIAGIALYAAVVGAVGYFSAHGFFRAEVAHRLWHIFYSDRIAEMLALLIFLALAVLFDAALYAVYAVIAKRKPNLY